MGRFDEDPKKVKRNEELAKKIIKINQFIMNPPSRILKILFLVMTWPSRIVHNNSKTSKFVQKHIVILTPPQYIMAALSTICFMIFVVPNITNHVLEQAAIYVVVYGFLLFLGMAYPGKGGGRKDKPKPPGGSTGSGIKPSEILIP
jgi:hypothetical protein